MAGEDQFPRMHSRLDLQGLPAEHSPSMPKGSSSAHQWLERGSYRILEGLEKAEPASDPWLFWILPGCLTSPHSCIGSLCPHSVLSLNHILDFPNLVISFCTKSFSAVYRALRSFQSLLWASCVKTITAYMAFGVSLSGPVVAGWVSGNHLSSSAAS